jgi:hypothetical protein
LENDSFAAIIYKNKLHAYDDIIDAIIRDLCCNFLQKYSSAVIQFKCPSQPLAAHIFDLAFSVRAISAESTIGAPPSPTAGKPASRKKPSMPPGV